VGLFFVVFSDLFSAGSLILMGEFLFTIVLTTLDIRAFRVCILNLTQNEAIIPSIIYHGSFCLHLHSIFNSSSSGGFR